MDSMIRRIPPLEAARWLVAAIMVAMLFSPPITILFELSLLFLMLGSGALRARLIGIAREPMVLGMLAFITVVTIGLAYGIENRTEPFGIWFSWRKLLLLPMAMALFDEDRWKLRLAWVLVVATVLCALASYVGVLFDVNYYKYLNGIVVRNHATQGIIFSVAAFAALVLLKFGPQHRVSQKLFLAAAALLLIANVVFVAGGRSGYVVLFILAVSLALGWPGLQRASFARRIGFVAGAMALTFGLLAVSPVARDRIAQGVKEIQASGQSEEVTSMSERVVYMRNALRLISERPIIGYGTGSFEAAYSRLVAGKTGVDGIKAHDPHNQFVKIVAEHGLIGLAVFIAFLGAAFRQRSRPPYRLLALGVLVAWCGTSLFSSHFSTFTEGRFLALWLGAFLARAGEQPHQPA